MNGARPKKKPEHYLRVFMDENTKEINIEGNAAGLEFLINACRAVIGQAPGANHYHLGESFGTLESSSLDLIVAYRELQKKP